MNLEKNITYVFYAIFAYLIIMNANAFNTIILSGGNFISSNIALLQGRSVGAPTGLKSYTLSSFG